jgi:hypothetical protein
MTDTNLGETVLDAVRGLVPDTQGQVRYAGKDERLNGTVSEAVVTGLDRGRSDTEQGEYKAIEEGSARYKKAKEPEAWGIIGKINGKGKEVEIPIIGDLVEVLLPGDTSFDDGSPVKARVSNRVVMAGAVRLDLIAEFQEV